MIDYINFCFKRNPKSIQYFETRIDEKQKKQAMELFGQLGIDMSSATNMFLRQCVLRGGLPFNVELPNYKPEVIEAMEEARKINSWLTLDEKHRDHELKEKYTGFRECHIQPDWFLIYLLEDEILTLTL